MSDIRILNINKEKLLKSQKLTTKEVREYIEKNANELLGLTLLASNYLLKQGTNDIIETFAIDETYRLVIIEYRSGKFGKIINKGLVYIDYIKENLSQIKMLISDKLGSDKVSNINYNPRLIVIGDDFNRYDEHSIKSLPVQVDLIKYQMYDNQYFVLEKNYCSKVIDHDDFTYKLKNRDQLALYKLINDFMLSLGDEVTEYGYKNVLCYRKINYFAYVIFNEEIEIQLNIKNKPKLITIKNEKDFQKASEYIEKAYDER